MCHFQVLRALELFGGSVVAELRNPASVVAQEPTSCASRVAQSWKLRKRCCAILGVAQAKFRNRSCASRPTSCAILDAQSGEVAESDFMRLVIREQAFYRYDSVPKIGPLRWSWNHQDRLPPILALCPSETSSLLHSHRWLRSAQGPSAW